jgi:hypothetical protein
MSRIDNNTSYLAGEFLVAGELARRGYPVSITMGRAKSVDIYVDTQQGGIAVDTKASRYKTDWPIRKDVVKENQFYVFLYLGTKEQIKEDKSPEYFIVKGADIKSLIKTWGEMQGIRYADLTDFKDRWDKLPPPS